MNPSELPYLFPALITGAALFSIGLAGIALRRSLIAMLMCIELMLTGVNITLVSFSQANADMNGQIMVFFIITVAAAEGAIGLGLLIALYRNMKEVSSAQLNQMKE